MTRTTPAQIAARKRFSDVNECAAVVRMIDRMLAGPWDITTVGRSASDAGRLRDALILARGVITEGMPSWAGVRKTYYPPTITSVKLDGVKA